MDRIEFEIKRDENTIKDIAEKIELFSNTNMNRKEELLQKFVAEGVIKNKMITVADHTFFELEKNLDFSNQRIKGYEKYKVDNKTKNDILDKVCGDKVKNIFSEKDEVYKNNSINRFIKILTNNKSEMLSNK